jgi:hypothetical protein
MKFEIKMSSEVWKSIEGLNSIFQVSNYGRIRRLGHVSKSGKYLRLTILKKYNSRSGYNSSEKHMYVYCYDGSGKTRSVSVAKTVFHHFVDNSINNYRIEYKDGNSENCRADNLSCVHEGE